MGVYEHILVGVDGSDASAEAATMAGRLAVDLDAKVTAVYVRQLPAVASSPFGMTMSLGSYWEELERLAAERAAEALDRTGACWRFEVRTGDPAVQLELSADDHGADLVVVGARGTRSPTGCCSGRSRPGWHHARRPVLLVRAPAEGDSRPDRAPTSVPSDRSADDQDRTVGQVDDLVGHAAQQQRHQVAAAMGAHDDHARLVGPGGVHDDRRHPPGQGADQLDLDRHTGPLEPLPWPLAASMPPRSWSAPR